MGDLDLVRCLGVHGIPVTLACREQAGGAKRSRYVDEVLELPPDDEAGAAARLEKWVRDQPAEGVIFPQGDDDLLLLSRRRSGLAKRARFVLARAELVEDLVDKVEFAALARRADLPVPQTRVVRRGDDMGQLLCEWRTYPAVMKPAHRHGWFGSPLQLQLRGSHKAIALPDKATLAAYLPLIEAHGTDFVLQQAIRGPEANIESYHVYVRDDGTIAGEFTGKKLRTFPVTYGLSTCVAVTDDREVRALGREVITRLDLTGVAKLDFKRDQVDGRLYLLEINPRFTLWNHLGAHAGVDIPKLVYDDLTGERRRQAGPARPGAIWMSSRADLKAVLAEKASVLAWLRLFAKADVHTDFTFADPLPGCIDLAAALGRKVANLRHQRT